MQPEQGRIHQRKKNKFKRATHLSPANHDREMREPVKKCCAHNTACTYGQAFLNTAALANWQE
jgi:hypothetical protein